MKTDVIAGLCAASLMLGAVAGPARATEEFAAEDQTPTRKYLTATEVRPILERTKRVWIGVREYEGQDWLYFTHLVDWRCGLHQLRYAINDGPLTVFPLTACDPADPEAIPDDQGFSVTYAPGGIETVTIDLLYDDLGTQTEVFTRADVLFE
ncbi:hypothetical protein [Shimia sp. SDUM112013]|uniref:hypothetical protein n=1 Tax=Shimia sp. SDUM112013 TaxID=3136160 RepID=UPI0032EE5709